VGTARFMYSLDEKDSSKFHGLMATKLMSEKNTTQINGAKISVGCDIINE
jgi:hypothetical protein